ncbi:MAG: radical SAM/SPASM family putative metalloenzyme maturase [Desulfococcaceae bacterium]
MPEPETVSPPSQRPHPTKLFVETTTRCNLRCAMCVKQSRAGGIAEGDMDKSTFSALSPAFPRLESLVLNGVGEPLMHPALADFAAQARHRMADDAWIGFQTNGRMVDRERARALVRAGVDRICLSADAVSPDMFRKMRSGGDVGDVDRALAVLSRARDETSESRLRLGVEFVLTRSNLAELPEVVRWAAARDAEFLIVTHMLPYAPDMAGEAVHSPNTDASVAYYREWRTRAEAEGVDMDRYFAVRWKYQKTPEEKRIVDWVDGMVRAAESREIPFHLKQLFAHDEAFLESAEAMFDQARSAAENAGISLRLPSLLPTAERRCDFVEEGAAFVSWDGRLHPCYFLWHRYSCYLEGREKPVEPVSFGRVNGRSPLDIWRDPEFVRFRERVCRYDYPFCGNCGLGPCDLITEPHFQHDCYTAQVPCGDCPWPLGLLQCLR